MPMFADFPRRFADDPVYPSLFADAFPPGNGGLFEFTGEPRDQGKFRVPTLRNIGLTAPYMHDATLAEVIDHYNAGGRAFLESLTDAEFAADPRFAAP